MIRRALFCVLMGLAAHAQAASLITGRVDKATSVEQDAGTLRVRAVAVHPQSLAVVVDKQGASAQTLQIRFFDDRVFDLALHTVEAASDGVEAFAGHIVGDAQASAVVVRRGAHVAADLRIGPRLYTLRYRGADRHEAAEIDLARAATAARDWRDDTVIAPPPSSTSVTKASAPTTLAKDEGDRIDVLVAYTPAARQSQGGTAAMASLADLVFVQANQMFERSGVVPRLRLAHLTETDYVENGSPNQGQIALDLYFLEHRNDGRMDELHTLRDTHGADLVSLWSNSQGAGGMAAAMVVESPAFESQAFSIAVREYVSTHGVFAHEVGHNLGLLHDHYSEQQDTTIIDGQVVAYAYGHVDTTHRFMDVMAYPNACLAIGVGCIPMPYFSNPDVNVTSWFDGAVAPIGSADANAARAINATSDTVSRFRDFPESSIGFAVSDYAISEGGSVQLRVTRSGNALDTASVQYTTQAGSARAGRDYSHRSGSVSWASGETGEKTVQLETFNSPLADGRRTLHVQLHDAINGHLADSGATVHIDDDESDAFPSGCALPSGWTQPAAADAGWQAMPGEAGEGVCALRSSPIAAGERAQIAYTGVFADGVIRFRRRVDSEAGWDFLRVQLDGVEVLPTCVAGESLCAGSDALGAAASGIAPDHASQATEWRSPEIWLHVPVGAGTHTLMFSYEKDADCCAQGEDAAWIDGLYLPLATSLTVNRLGPGRVRSLPAGVDCGVACSLVAPIDALVLLSAEPDAGMSFVGWSDCPDAVGRHCALTMTTTQHVVATFADLRTVPAAPVIGSASAGDHAATVSFLPSTNDGGSPILRYTATSTPDALSASCDAPCTAIIVPALVNGTEYRFSVRATNLIGDSAPSALSNAVVPLHMHTVTPSAGEYGTITPDTPQQVADGSTTSFELTSKAGYASFVAGSCGGSLNGQIYTTAAIDEDCTVEASFATLPSAPQLVDVQPLPQAARVVFAAPASDGGRPVLDYRARCLPGTANQTATASPIDVGALINGTLVRCSVQARNAVGLGPASAELGVVPRSGDSNANLSISKSNGTDFINDVAPVNYTIVVGNTGPDAIAGAHVEDALADQFASASWTCTPSGIAAWCPPSGNGGLDFRADLPAAGTLQIAFSAMPVPGTAPIFNVAAVTPPSGVVDPNLNNNVASDGPDVRGVFRNGFE